MNIAIVLAPDPTVPELIAVIKRGFFTFPALQTCAAMQSQAATPTPAKPIPISATPATPDSAAEISLAFRK
jgi:hypothetical protein